MLSRLLLLLKDLYCSLNYLMLSSNVLGSMIVWTAFVLLLVFVTVFPVNDIYTCAALTPFCILLPGDLDQSNQRSLCKLIDFHVSKPSCLVWVQVWD